MSRSSCVLAGQNPLDRRLTLTRFDDVTAQTAKAFEISLRELAPKIAAKRAPEKADLPWLKLASFGDERSRKGSLRHNGNLLSIDGVEGDHDAGTLTPQEAAEKLRSAGIAALIHTSPSHKPERPRWRVLCPTDAPLPPGDRERLVARLNGVLEGALHPESFALSQGFYYGSVDGGSKVETILVDGAALDTLEGLDAGALDKRGKAFSGGKTTEIGPGHFLYVDPADMLSPADDDEIFGRPDVAKVGRALDAIPVEARDDREACWRPVGMALHSEFRGSEEGFEIWDAWSRESEKHDADDQRRVWESFGRHSGKPTGIATLYAMADNHEKAWRKAKPDSKPSRLTVLTPADCMEAPARGYVIKRLIAPRDVACIFGAPGGGKSTIAPYLGYRVATGDEAFGLRTKPGSVLYVAAEDAHGMKNRVKALRGQLGDTADFYVVEGVSDLLEEDSPDLEALREVANDKRPSLIFLDTLAMSFRDLEENDAAAMNRVVAIARDLTHQGAAVVLIHHGTKAEGSTPRGHSVLNGALDVALQLLPPDSEGVIRGRLSKNRNGPCDLDIAFRVASEELGIDEDGDAITAAIVDELPAGAAPRSKPLPHAQREALAILTKLEERGPVSDESWRDACIDSRLVSQSEDRDNRKRSFNRARTALFRAGLVALDDGRAASRHPDMDWPDDEDEEAEA
ncbi:MAG: AAA family ATPase [Pseudomonadota bacterium]|nr:AAA family ATPase [Pseudomonadota bacterium]